MEFSPKLPFQHALLQRSGSLSFMAAPPSVTKTLQMIYLRPIPPAISEINVVAWLAGEEDSVDSPPISGHNRHP